MPNEYKEMKIYYKYADLPDEPRYKKRKKKKKVERSDHKHHYEKCLFRQEKYSMKNMPWMWGGTYCTICGRIGNISIGSKIIMNDNNLPCFVVEDLFKDKFVSLPQDISVFEE